MRKRHVLLALTLGLIGAWNAAGFAVATDPVLVSSKSIASGNLDPVNFVIKNEGWMAQLRTKGATDVAVVENTVEPGGSFGWHSHPGPSLIIVKEGEITFYRADDPTCTPQIHRAGDAFIDEGTGVHVGINRGSVNLVVIVTRLLPDGAKARNDAPDPGICGV